MTNHPIRHTFGKFALPLIAVVVIALLIMTIALDVSDSTFEKAMFVVGLGFVAWAGVLARRYYKDETYWHRLRWLLPIQMAFGLKWASELFTIPGTRGFYVVNLMFYLIVGILLVRALREPVTTSP